MVLQGNRSAQSRCGSALWSNRCSVQQEVQNILEMLECFRLGGCLLCIGCSTCLFVQAAGKCGWTAKAIEHSPKTAEVARRANGLDVMTDRLDSTNFAGEGFGIVTRRDALEHPSDLKATLAQAVNRLRLGAAARHNVPCGHLVSAPVLAPVWRSGLSASVRTVPPPLSVLAQQARKDAASLAPFSDSQLHKARPCMPN